MNDIMLSTKNITFLLLVLVGHIVFSKCKDELLDDLQGWWHEFVELATKYVSEDEIN